MIYTVVQGGSVGGDPEWQVFQAPDDDPDRKTPVPGLRSFGSREEADQQADQLNQSRSLSDE